MTLAKVFCIQGCLVRVACCWFCLRCHTIGLFGKGCVLLVLFEFQRLWDCILFGFQMLWCFVLFVYFVF